MKYLLIITIFLFSSQVDGSNKIEGKIDINKLDLFLAKLYAEVKCPDYPLKPQQELEICLHSLTYELDDGRIFFAFTAYPNHNRFLLDFYKKSKEEREGSMKELLHSIGRYLGVLPLNAPSKQTQPFYSGKVQRTPLSHAYNKEILEESRVIHDFVRDNAVVGIRVVDGEIQYVSFLDLNRELHYKEGDGISILDFKANPTQKPRSQERIGTSTN